MFTGDGDGLREDLGGEEGGVGREEVKRRR